MKKTNILIFAALLLVLVVACSSAPKLTGILIKTTTVATPSDIKTATFTYSEKAKGSVSLDVVDVKAGSVFVDMEPGEYTGSITVEYNTYSSKKYEVKQNLFNHFQVVDEIVTECVIEELEP